MFATHACSAAVTTPIWRDSSYDGMTECASEFHLGEVYFEDVPAGFGASLGQALSGGDVRHRLAFTSVYQLPAGPGRR